ncbi:MAG: cell division protein SepF [Thermoleophilia bacterium]|jgi:cell division inhibitor SepF|nr:cell division protein SepF [Thermoleophilia bacterium]
MSVHALPDPLQVHMITPTTFNEARRLADRLKAGHPVFVDLRAADSALVERLLDFAEGLSAALQGSVTRVSDTVVLVAPDNVTVSGAADGAEEVRRAEEEMARVRPLRRLGLA